MTPEERIVRHWHRVPVGASTGTSQGRRWRAVRSVHAGGRSEKIVAHERGGADYVSCNLYRLAAGPRAIPCEMPAARVAAVLSHWTTEAGPEEPSS